MIRKKRSAAASAAVITGSDNSEVALEARKAEMARIAEEADAKEAEALASAENAVGDGNGNGSAGAVAIPKPSNFDLNKFKSKRADAIANVDTLQTGLPISNMSQAKDFVRLHPDEENYWSHELCFVNVPIKGAKRDSLHLIEEDLAMRFLPSGKVQRFRLALAAKPHELVLPLSHPDPEPGQLLEPRQRCGV